MGLKAQAARGLFSLLSLVFCILSLSVFNIKMSLSHQTLQVTPFRWLSATLAPLVLVSSAYDKKSLSTSGALMALVVCFILILANYMFFLSLLAFFVTSNMATKYKAELKECYGGSRGKIGWQRVLCSCGVAVYLSVLYLLDLGSAEPPIDFRHQYTASWFGCAVLGSISCRCGDTWATQLGSLLSFQPRLVTSLRHVPRVSH